MGCCISCIAINLIVLGRFAPSLAEDCESRYLGPLDGTDALPAHFPSFLRTDDAPLGIPLNSSDGLLYSNYTNFQQWRKLLRDLEDGGKETLNIVVFGGSLTVGHFAWNLPQNAYKDHKTPYSNKGLKCEGQCETSYFVDTDNTTYAWNGDFGQGNCKPCAFPARFGDWLALVYPNVTVTINNRAIAATSSRDCVEINGEFISEMENVDVVLLSFSFNDWTSSQYLGDEVMTASFEELVRIILDSPSAPVLIDLELNSLCCGSLPRSNVACLFDNFCDSNVALFPRFPHYGYPPHLAVARHYHVPVVSYDAVVLRDLSGLSSPLGPPSNASGTGPWSHLAFSEAHPPWPYHQLIADLLAYVWRHQAVQACNEVRLFAEHTSHSHQHIIPTARTQWRGQSDKPDGGFPGGESDPPAEESFSTDHQQLLHQYQSQSQHPENHKNAHHRLAHPIPELQEVRETLFSFCIHHLTFIRASDDPPHTPSVEALNQSAVTWPATLTAVLLGQAAQSAVALSDLSVLGDVDMVALQQQQQQQQQQHGKVRGDEGSGSADSCGQWQYGEELLGSGKLGWWIDARPPTVNRGQGEAAQPVLRSRPQSTTDMSAVVLGPTRDINSQEVTGTIYSDLQRGLGSDVTAAINDVSNATAAINDGSNVTTVIKDDVTGFKGVGAGRPNQQLRVTGTAPDGTEDSIAGGSRLLNGCANRISFPILLPKPPEHKRKVTPRPTAPPIHKVKSKPKPGPTRFPSRRPTSRPTLQGTHPPSERASLRPDGDNMTLSGRTPTFRPTSKNFVNKTNTAVVDSIKEIGAILAGAKAGAGASIGKATRGLSPKALDGKEGSDTEQEMRLRDTKKHNQEYSIWNSLAASCIWLGLQLSRIFIDLSDYFRGRKISPHLHLHSHSHSHSHSSSLPPHDASPQRHRIAAQLDSLSNSTTSRLNHTQNGTYTLSTSSFADGLGVPAALNTTAATELVRTSLQHHILASITVGYLSSYKEEMGVVQVYLDDDMEHLVAIDAWVPESHGSVTRTARLCWGYLATGSEVVTPTPAAGPSSSASITASAASTANAANRASTASTVNAASAGILYGDKPVLLPSCDHFDESDRHTNRNFNGGRDQIQSSHQQARRRLQEHRHLNDTVTNDTSLKRHSYGRRSRRYLVEGQAPSKAAAQTSKDIEKVAEEQQQYSHNDQALSLPGAYGHSHRTAVHSYRRWNPTKDGEAHTLHIELLPMRNRSGTKFKIIFISTC